MLIGIWAGRPKGRIGWYKQSHMTISILFFLYAFYAFLAFWGLFSLVAVTHLMKYGFKTFTTFITAFGYMAVSLVMLAVIFNYVTQFDWTGEVSLLSGLFEINNQFISF